MSMHLTKVFVSSGKKKSKQKWASAEQKRKHLQLEQEWTTLKQKWGATTTKSKQKTTTVSLPTEGSVHIRDTGPKPKSLNSWQTGAVNTKQTTQYTGDNLLGITIVHKSCLQPVFNKEAAVDAATMRR